LSPKDLSEYIAAGKRNILCPVEWVSEGIDQPEGIYLIDQRVLPHEFKVNHYADVRTLSEAITEMVVRGAPAIGITAAYGVVLAAREAYAQSGDRWRETIENNLALLMASRPTAVNLQWAIERMRGLFESIEGDPEFVLLAEAISIHDKDIVANIRMGELGAGLIEDKCQVLTHCNAGALATGGYGTALGVIRTAHKQGKISSVYACETRPWLQGARLTAWELQQDNIPTTILVDSAACHLYSHGGVKWLIVGADRIAANGDVCNKIGTYSHAVTARHHGIRVMVVAPTSTFDLNAKSGQEIPIEQRAKEEILIFSGIKTAPENVAAWNPAFDVTPANLIDFIVTEKGIIEAPDSDNIRRAIH
jgi:methylthioribose-1-phosphate isomerase